MGFKKVSISKPEWTSRNGNIEVFNLNKDDVAACFVTCADETVTGNMWYNFGADQNKKNKSTTKGRFIRNVLPTHFCVFAKG